MCDMQKMPSREDASCEDDRDDMNFAAFSGVGGTGTHFVTTSGQLPVAKLQQNVQNNGGGLSQVVGMVGGVSMGEGGVQYVRTVESGMQNTPQLISVPITLPGAKPGDPQPMVQIQVLNPNMWQTQQQPKYQMQITTQQGLQQGGAVLTVAYSPDNNESGGIQLVGQNALTDANLQVLAALPQEMQLLQPTQIPPDDKSQIQHQVFITPNQQIIINGPEDSKMNNITINNNNNNDDVDIVIKEECDDNANDDESSQGTEASDSSPWAINSSQQDLVKFLNNLPPQQTQTLPLSLQQFLKLNPTNHNEDKKPLQMEVEVEVEEKKNEEAVAEAIIGEDGSLRIESKKKKKYKKKPKPARPKPGQVVIATAADGTPIFCCPECQMAYPVKEQLEMHLVVHKIERRFICGICGAGLKRKEHLERHKLGHNPDRPYVCGVCRKGFKRREHLNLHTVIHSGVKTEMCTECGKGFYRKDHLRKHTRSHESKRARDEANAETNALFEVKREVTPTSTNSTNTIMPEIIVHVPTSSNLQLPVQINIPQHVVSSLAAAQAAHAASANASDTQAQLEALLAQHT